MSRSSFNTTLKQRQLTTHSNDDEMLTNNAIINIDPMEWFTHEISMVHEPKQVHAMWADNRL